MLTSRRALLQYGTAMLTAASLGRVARADPTPRRRTPRYLVQIILFGGIDAVLTTDPKEKSEVDSDIDVPYSPNDILSAGNLRFGPNLAALTSWAPKMTVVNSVFVGTANHPAAGRQALHLRIGANDRMPAAMEVIGAHRDTQALGAVSLGMGPLTSHSVTTPTSMSPAILDAVDSASAEDLTMLATVMRRQAKDLGRSRATREQLDDTATFLERVVKAPRFAIDSKWPSLVDADDAEMLADDLQRTLWLLENDLTRCVFMASGNFDTHAGNLVVQGNSSRTHFPVINDFLTELEKRKNQHGSLLDNTVVMVSSELGRYPTLNRLRGKDHFPEMPVLFFGAVEGKGHAFGRSGRRMQATSISKKNGQPLATNQGSPTLDDVGTTMLRLFGVNPDACGYGGDTLEFLGA